MCFGCVEHVDQQLLLSPKRKEVKETYQACRDSFETSNVDNLAASSRNDLDSRREVNSSSPSLVCQSSLASDQSICPWSSSSHSSLGRRRDDRQLQP